MASAPIAAAIATMEAPKAYAMNAVEYHQNRRMTFANAVILSAAVQLAD
jgi:hypothetical protein